MQHTRKANLGLFDPQKTYLELQNHPKSMCPWPFQKDVGESVVFSAVTARPHMPKLLGSLTHRPRGGWPGQSWWLWINTVSPSIFRGMDIHRFQPFSMVKSGFEPTHPQTPVHQSHQIPISWWVFSH